LAPANRRFHWRNKKERAPLPVPAQPTYLFPTKPTNDNADVAEVGFLQINSHLVLGALLAGGISTQKPWPFFAISSRSRFSIYLAEELA
jgi:hypothetical protein